MYDSVLSDVGGRKGCTDYCAFILHLVDVDECVGGVADCPLYSQCINTVPGYHCDCLSGFEVADSECDGKLAFLGKFAISHSTCEKYVQVIPCTFSCIVLDINECLTGSAQCDPDHATCQNLPGTFSCTCDSGYIGDGFTCTGK